MAERTIIEKSADGFVVRFSDDSILIKDLRASYPHCVTPQKGWVDKEGKPVPPSYSVTGIMPKDTHRAGAALLSKIMKEMLAAENKGADIKADAKFVRDGNLSGKEMYKGAYTISARQSVDRPPYCRAADGRTPLVSPRDDKAIYGGCYINMIVRPWWQSNASGKRINANLLGVQKTRDGEPFGEGSISAEVIDETFGDESSPADWADDTDGL